MATFMERMRGQYNQPRSDSAVRYREIDVAEFANGVSA